MMEYRSGGVINRHGFGAVWLGVLVPTGCAKPSDKNNEDNTLTASLRTDVPSAAWIDDNNYLLERLEEDFRSAHREHPYLKFYVVKHDGSPHKQPLELEQEIARCSQVVQRLVFSPDGQLGHRHYVNPECCARPTFVGWTASIGSATEQVHGPGTLAALDRWKQLASQVILHIPKHFFSDTPIWPFTSQATCKFAANHEQWPHLVFKTLVNAGFPTITKYEARSTQLQRLVVASLLPPEMPFETSDTLDAPYYVTTTSIFDASATALTILLGKLSQVSSENVEPCAAKFLEEMPRSLTKDQLLVLRYLENRSCYETNAYIESATNLSKATVQKIVAKLLGFGLIDRRNGPRRGVAITSLGRSHLLKFSEASPSKSSQNNDR